jgi:uncharacterized protein (TIRG00374 family)
LTFRLPSPVFSSTALDAPVSTTNPPPAESPLSTSEPTGLTPGGGKPTSFLRRHGFKTALSIALAIGFVWVLRRGGLPIFPERGVGTHWQRFVHALSDVRWDLYALHVGLLLVLHTFRAVRWRHLLHPIAPDVSNKRVLAASWIGFTAILLLPLRAGEIVRPYLIRDGKKISLSAALGTMGAERVIDGLVVTLVLAGALVFVPKLDPLPQSFGELHIPVAAIPAAGYVALVIFVCAFVAMAVFYFARDFARRLVHATIGRINEKLGERLARIVEGIASGLHFLAGARHAVPFLLETLAYWTLNATMMWVLGLACGLPMTFGIACSVMGVLAVGILVPAGPGLFGAFQAATYGALAMYFSPSMITDQGAVYVFLLYATQFVWGLIAAGVGTALDPKMWKRAEATVQQVA